MIFFLINLFDWLIDWLIDWLFHSNVPMKFPVGILFYWREKVQIFQPSWFFGSCNVAVVIMWTARQIYLLPTLSITLTLPTFIIHCSIQFKPLNWGFCFVMVLFVVVGCFFFSLVHAHIWLHGFLFFIIGFYLLEKLFSYHHHHVKITARRENYFSVIQA